MRLGSRSVEKAYAFQCEAMLYDSTLRPDEIMELLDDDLDVLDLEYQVETTEAILVELRRRLRAEVRLGSRGGLPTVAEVLELARVEVVETRQRVPIVTDDAHHMCRHVTLTPSGRTHDGPFLEQTNSVLRRFGPHVDSFMRVSYAADDLSLPTLGQNGLSHTLLFNLIYPTLTEGVEIAGRLFEYVGHSLSSLRSRTVWFLTPIPGEEDNPRIPLDEDGDPLVPDSTRAEDVRRLLGEWRALQTTPMLYAARVSQAFTTSFASIAFRLRDITRIPDITHYNVKTTSHVVYSDGCGLMSTKTRDKIWDLLCKEGRVNADEPAPDVFQIRIAGYKGIIARDKQLCGDALCLRPSQHKYEVAAFDIEDARIYLNICQHFAASPVYFNRPLISALDDLGVPFEVFERLMIKAIGSVSRGKETLEGVSSLLQRGGFGGGSRLLSLVKHLVKFDPDSKVLSERSLLTDAIECFSRRSKRDIVAAGRIEVPDSFNVVGIPDFPEGTLKEGQIYCCVRDAAGEERVLAGKVLVARAPVVDPGDLRILHAVGKIKDTSNRLNGLVNCVVFSTRSSTGRSITSTMGGGDLDGDRFDIITFQPLIPVAEVEPRPLVASTPPLSDRHTGTMTDVANFVYLFFSADTLGIVSAAHLAQADKNPLHGRSDECRALADMHGVATESIKTGHFVPVGEIPRVAGKRPSFMRREGDASSDYYCSTRILGRLYGLVPATSIEEDSADGTRAAFSPYPAENEALARVKEEIATRTLELLTANAVCPTSEAHIQMARRLRLNFVSQLQQVAEVDAFPRRPGSHLSEAEIMCGTISKDDTKDKLGRRNAVDRLRHQTQVYVDALDDTIGADVDLGQKMMLLMALHDEAVSNEAPEFGDAAYGLIVLALILETLEAIEKNGESWRRPRSDYPQPRSTAVIPPNFESFNPSVVAVKVPASRDGNTKHRRKLQREAEARRLALELQEVELAAARDRYASTGSSSSKSAMENGSGSGSGSGESWAVVDRAAS